MAKPGAFRRMSSRVVLDNRFVTVRQDEVETPAGTRSPYTAVHFKVCGIAVLPIDANGCTRIVHQHRYVSDRYTWELPRGGGDPDAPLEAAQRELREETGLESDRWLHIFDLMASPGITDEIAPCFVAWGVRQGRPERDTTEDIALRTIRFADAVDLVLSGKITDAASSALLLAVHARAQRNDLPAELLALLK